MMLRKYGVNPMPKYIRLSARQRRNMIILAIKKTYGQSSVKWSVTHEAVASNCIVKTSVSTVRRYFPTKDDIFDVIENG